VSHSTLFSWPLRIVVITYVVGIVGIVLPLTRPWFALLTPVHLLLTLGLLLSAHHPLPRAALLICLIVYLAGFGIEVLGVQSGFPFGHYTYGTVLGPKLFHTPLIIGVNWLLLVLCTRDVAARFTSNIGIQALLGAALMTGLDVLIEPVAIALGFWHWYGQPVPLQNYIAWYVCAAAFIALLNHRWPHASRNPLGPIVYGAQVVFFAVLNMVFAFS